MSRYVVNDIFWTVQGEGQNAGRAAMFVRFAGCNLWNGHARGRDKGSGACAAWCDTDFAKGEAVDANELARRMEYVSINHGVLRGDTTLCVLTGGEPCLQIDRALVKHLRREGWEVAVETNGTRYNDALDHIDHVCVSPKLGTELEVVVADELKVVLPGASPAQPTGWTASELLDLTVSGRWGRMYVQPQDPLLGPEVENTALSPLYDDNDAAGGRQVYQRHVELCLDWVRQHPDWRLSLQTHKLVGVP